MTAEPLPSPVAAALPLLAEGARRWLPPLLRPLAEARRPDRWRASLLTPRRCPVELSVATACPHTTRYATEFVSPDLPPPARLGAGLTRLHELGLPAPDPVLRARLLAAHREHEVAWGVWLGGRHDADGDRFKLYAEVPKSAAVPFERELTAALGVPPFPLPQARLRLVGIDLTGSTVERYYRVGRLSMAEFALLAPSPARPYAPSFTAEVGVLLGRPGLDDFPGVNVNVSCAGDVLTVSGPARTWLGPDADARRRLLDYATVAGLDLSRYAALSAAMPGDAGHHAIVSVSLVPGGPLHLTVGFSPPGTSPDRNTPVVAAKP